LLVSESGHALAKLRAALAGSIGGTSSDILRHDSRSLKVYGCNPSARRIVLGSGMDRDTTLNLLALALRHVAEVERLIAQQHEIITSLERNDLDTSPVKVALVQIEQLHDMLVADRDRLEEELAEMEPHSSPSLRISCAVKAPSTSAILRS
jgi:hypothetical protein